MSDWAGRMNEAMSGELTPRRAEMRRVGSATRRVIERLVATEAPVEALERAATALEAIAGDLEGYPQGHIFEGFSESANAGDPYAFFDHSPLMGAANPLAPPLVVGVEDGRVVGRARFGSAYEGPPGCVHGGFVAAAFDEVLGMAQSMSGNPGMTGTLTVRYRNPTPLHVDLRFEGRLLRVEGRKIFTEGTVHHGESLTAEADGIFISVDFSRLRALYGERRRPS